MNQSELPSLGTFNVSVIGPPSVGKTAFIHKHFSGEFVSEYTPTTGGVHISPTSFYMVGDDLDGVVEIIMLDHNMEHASGGAWAHSHAVIFMFDWTNEDTFDTAVEMHHLFQQQFPVTPSIVVGNKFDLLAGGITEQFNADIDTDLHVNISSKTNYNYEKPFLYLIRQLLGDSTLEFETMPVVAPPSVVIPPHLQALLLQELEAAGMTPLPDLPDIEENDLSLSDLEPVSYEGSWSIDSASLDFSSSDDEF